ncbi:MAG TPA: tetratricopeptide repeat protein [Vicinamibacteria bacterium]
MRALSLQPRILTLLFASMALPAAARPAAGVQAAPERDDEARFERAMAQHRAGDVLGAIDAYLAILERAPGRADVRSNLGAAYARLGRHEEAIAQYRQALAVRGEDPAIRFNLGLALFKAARFPEAAEELARVVEKQPENKGALLLLAECHLQQGNTAKVVELLAPHEAAWGEDRAFAFLLGSALVRENDLKRGQIFIDRVLSGGDSAEARLLMGAAHLRAGDPQAAREALRRAAELQPTLPGVHSLLGQALQYMGDGQGAEAAYRRELETNPNDFDANLHLGNLRRDEGRFDEARAYLTRAARLRGDDLGVLHAMGSLHVSTGDFQKAREALEPLVERAPEFQQGHVLLAMTYARLGRMEDAERERGIAQKLGKERQKKEEAVLPSRPPGSSRQDAPPADRPRRGEDER